MAYIIKKDGVKEHLFSLSNQLAQIEVKGDSVERLYIARRMLKELFDAIEELPEEKKEGANDKRNIRPD